ncbi:hypothetical protein [Mesorhizobium sp.]|uniref:hypothetical protein n=1 Tax=Mesorhizobium sp. TaxID=1871066 RepID=UPI000FE6EBE0|nr:hypothetical protein [Mesorhizobium sp.]RWM26974.1 MAG: hypothetical protein EOR74_14335 [Mesorhizobium sp.]RWM34903.1 MAG: hypothetical protein EOR75_25035 [Mesorhizobium sp.]TJV53325.1 MAG: hypothetical protein E5Y01_03150 [Mesorhizobium sp.]
MVQFCVDIAAESPCRNCEAAVPLEVDKYPECSTLTYRLTFTDFFGEIEAMRILNARLGGLVVGRHGTTDDIPMYLHVGGGIFEMSGLMHGGEFILSHMAAAKHRETIERINSEKGRARDMPLRYSTRASVINTNLMPPGGALWINHGQFIVNGFATAKHLEKLEQLNADGNPESFLSIGLP